MRTPHRLVMALAACLMLAPGAGGTVAQASSMPGANPVVSLASRSALPVHPVNSPPAICPADQIPGAATPLPNGPQQYFKNDPRLGPKFLPNTGQIGELLRGYPRLDSFRSGPFIDCFWDDNATSSSGMRIGGWRFPPNNGFADGFNQFFMQPTQVIDRFGPNTGSFFSPFGVPFAQRALPPSNLDTDPADPTHPFSYHVFRVTSPFLVQAGAAAPWFGQAGGGMQFHAIDNQGHSVSAQTLLSCCLVEVPIPERQAQPAA